MMQLDMFAALAPAPPVFLPDMVAERLIETALVGNRFLLTLTRCLHVPCHELPSRLFEWPCEFVDRSRREDGMSTILLNHPDLASFPFVDELEDKTGVRPHWEAHDEFGRERNNHRYFHAMDLLTDEHWHGLMETRNFTDYAGIVCGLKYRMDYGGLSLKNARTVLSEIGSVEPVDRSAAFLRSDAVRINNTQQGNHVGMWSKDEQPVWAAIHGLEDGLFKRRGGFLTFSKEFLAEKELAA